MAGELIRSGHSYVSTIDLPCQPRGRDDRIKGVLPFFLFCFVRGINRFGSYNVLYGKVILSAAVLYCTFSVRHLHVINIANIIIITLLLTNAGHISFFWRLQTID